MSFLRTCADCVLLLDPEGRISFVNDTGLHELAVPRRALGRPLILSDLWPKDARASGAAAVARAVAGEAVRFESSRPGADGISRAWDLTLSPITDVDGDVETVFAIMGPG